MSLRKLIVSADLIHRFGNAVPAEKIYRLTVNLIHAPPPVFPTVDVLVQNFAASAFWRSVGYQDYSLTLEILPVTGSV